eukprot:550337-Amphidinium_carterae.1
MLRRQPAQLANQTRPEQCPSTGLPKRRQAGKCAGARAHNSLRTGWMIRTSTCAGQAYSHF